MALYTLGINHKTAPLAVRERVSFGPEQVLEALPMLGQLAVVEELVVLSTCNRTEIYCSLTENSPDQVLEWLGEYHKVGLTELKKAAYFHRNEEAARHMMRVASGLDSMVLGEPQIFGQLKEAYTRARNLGAVGGTLDRLFQHTFSVAKRVRTETAIGENPVSVAFAAVGMASRIFTDLSKSTALLIGAGETIELAARHLFQSGVRSLIVANRTLARARDLASAFHGSAVGLSDIPHYLHRADIVIASTASTLPILGKGAVELALKKRRHRAMFMVDLAVPRDIEEQVDDLDDVYLYTVDDLRGVINDNLKSRKDAAADAEKLIAAGAAEFMYHLRALDSVSMLKSFRDQVERVRDEEVNKALKSLQKGRQPEEVIRLLAHGLSNKIIHQPTVQVRKASAEGRAEVSGWLRDLFQLPDDQISE